MSSVLFCSILCASAFIKRSYVGTEPGIIVYKVIDIVLSKTHGFTSEGLY